MTQKVIIEIMAKVKLLGKTAKQKVKSSIKNINLTFCQFSFIFIIFFYLRSNREPSTVTEQEVKQQNNFNSELKCM